MRRAPERVRRARLTLVALALGVAAARPARAQEERAPMVVLRDADAAPLVAALRADRAQMEARGRYAGEHAAQAARDFTAHVVLADSADPLAYVKARTAHFAVPPDARYAEACSRDFSRVYLRPAAVFALGKPADEIGEALRGKTSAAELSQKEIWQLMMAQGRSSAGQAYESAGRYYRAHGFALDGPVELSADYVWRGVGSDRLVASVFPTNKGAGDGAAACGALGNTALVILHVRGDVVRLGEAAERSLAATAARATADDFAATLRRVGLDSARFEALRQAAMTAYVEADAPEALDTMDRIATQEGKADERRAIAVLRQNVAWYQRHAAELEPLFRQLRSR